MTTSAPTTRRTRGGKRPIPLGASPWQRRFREAEGWTTEGRLVLITLSTYAETKGIGMVPHLDELAEQTGLDVAVVEHYVLLACRFGWVRRAWVEDMRAPFRFRLTSPPPGYQNEEWF